MKRINPLNILYILLILLLVVIGYRRMDFPAQAERLRPQVR